MQKAVTRPGSGRPFAEGIFFPRRGEGFRPALVIPPPIPGPPGPETRPEHIAGAEALWPVEMQDGRFPRAAPEAKEGPRTLAGFGRHGDVKRPLLPGLPF